MPEIDPRKIDYVPLSELSADPRNPKSHDLETIQASVGRFGFLEPIIRDERTGYIVSGHGRLQALKAMQSEGQTPPEGVQLSPDGTWLAPTVVGWASRSDNEAAAALIALNRTTELGGWVDESLLELLDDLSKIEDGLDGVGFEEFHLDDLRHMFDESPEGYRDLQAMAEEFGEMREEDLEPSPTVIKLSLPEPLASQFLERIGKSPQQQEAVLREWLESE